MVRFPPAPARVTPSAERCDTAEDDDCDGEANEDDCACAADDVFSCYEGAPQTEGVGICVAGVQQCGPGGMPVGPCLGQTLPVSEECGVALDEDCNGAVNEWCPDVARSWGGSGSQRIVGVDERNGRAALAISNSGTLDFEVITLTSAGPTDFVVAMVDASDATPLWATGTMATGEQFAEAVAIDAAGDVYAAGSFENMITLDVTYMATGWDGFVVKLDGNTGAMLWSYVIAGADNIFARDITIDPVDDEVVVSGRFEGNAFFDNTNVTPVSSSGDDDAFVLKLNAAGSFVWVTTFGGAGYEEAASVATDASSNIYAAGRMNRIVFPGSDVAAIDGPDPYVVMLDDGGAHVWTSIYAGAGLVDHVQVAVDASGVFLAGELDETIDLGAGVLVAAGQEDIFVGKMDPNGAPLWGRIYGDALSQELGGISVGPNGNVALVGSFRGAIVFDDKLAAAAGDDDLYVLALASDGSELFARRFGDGDDQDFRDVTHAPNGDIIGVGDCRGDLQIDAGVTLSTGGSDDACILRLAP